MGGHAQGDRGKSGSERDWWRRALKKKTSGFAVGKGRIGPFREGPWPVGRDLQGSGSGGFRFLSWALLESASNFPTHAARNAFLEQPHHNDLGGSRRLVGTELVAKARLDRGKQRSLGFRFGK